MQVQGAEGGCTVQVQGAESGCTVQVQGAQCGCTVQVQVLSARGRSGIQSARAREMGVRHFTELRCWQHSSELKRRMYALCARLPASQDREFCSQVRRAAASAPRNLSEGFARFNHREFQQFARIARGSLGETQDALIDARDRGYLEQLEFDELWRISEDATRATTGLMKYLQETKDRRFWGKAERKD